jgi:hypothetical protein
MIITLVGGEKREVKPGVALVGLMIASIEYTYEDTQQPGFFEFLQSSMARLAPKDMVEKYKDHKYTI